MFTDSRSCSANKERNGTREVEVEGFKILVMVKVTQQSILEVVYSHTCRSLGCSYIAARGAKPPQRRT
jgi:hypothetical protein